MIPYGKQNISQQDIDAVVDVLKSDWLTQGPKVPLFESAVAQYCKSQYAVATNSATSALHIACMALNVSEGDVVWTSPNSFIASANCARYCGASVDFVDIELETGNMCVDALKSKLADAQQHQRLPKVLIPVHFAGQSCDMKAIAQLAKQYGFKIIEDASHAVGGRYDNKPIGNCEYSDICVFSFHPVKIITSAEGGMAMTNDEKLAATMCQLRSHGVVSDDSLFAQTSHGPWYYEQHALGYNYRMTDIHAALGYSQLNSLGEFVHQRNVLAQHYDKLLATSEKVLPLVVHSNCYSAYHLYVVKLLDCDPVKHSYVVKKLRELGIYAHVHYIPIYLQPYYQQQGFQQGYCPNAEQYYHSAITLPLFPELSEEQQQDIVDNLLALIND
ncbi:UDP-4-amino-4,6-dideoxy-N-acetyl-beta-L-altrosamine transaminase [Pseudoalteromonas byunsanensis]|uniref:UDP-4-amino-4, 6-dideoxy-N-acetyl-beta-L-altrosamine transaminase n=1 Tax=Pseudoalteromonas byunsanensis TaxID=327939 RepID=A0A1S1NAR9_9GAMM|nr:UDP-4-amino-4,6-dideoxy-N-acetyl-beta-L-altrosamine transaminase [Pseudoalteromonas byunsanensis]OHU95799.1 UDP-4-amino-4,6-dideoxy-N-acetyl-beta-L-altrosamine transaminase [Pseudoalteromonas byunsanensis]